MEAAREGPEWQDDTEVSSCFVCHSRYTFFNRRHHCRKCGRVVCGDCSERQVTYFLNTSIANPENNPSFSRRNEYYRTCDECAEEILMIRRALFGGSPGSGPGPSLDTEIDPSDPNSASGSSSASSTRGVSIGGTLASTGDNDLSNNSDNDSTTKYSTRTTTHIMESSTESSDNQTIPLSNNGHRHRHRGGRRRHNRDEDSDSNLCPVCAVNLLKLYINDHKETHSVAEISHDDFEKYKETHIDDCLTAFDFNSDTQRLNSPRGARGHTRNKMLVYNIPPIPKPRFETIPHNIEPGSYDTIQQQPISSSSNHAIYENEVAGSINSNSTIQPGAEKQDLFKGIDNECVICLEDLKQGDKVGRLECLCVVHYKCIKDWFNKKGYGECPVHFVHQ